MLVLLLLTKILLSLNVKAQNDFNDPNLASYLKGSLFGNPDAKWTEDVPSMSSQFGNLASFDNQELNEDDEKSDDLIHVDDEMHELQTNSNSFEEKKFKESVMLMSQFGISAEVANEQLECGKLLL